MCINFYKNFAIQDKAKTWKNNGTLEYFIVEANYLVLKPLSEPLNSF